MTTWHTSQHRVALAGIVTDAGTGKVLAGVDVRLTVMPEEWKAKVALSLLKYGRQADLVQQRLDRTQTAPNGLFYFADLPAGEYMVTAEVPRSAGRYASGQQSATLSHDANEAMQRVWLTLTLQPTTFKGKVTSAERGADITMAEVRVKGGFERKFSDVNGDYTLERLQPGKYTVCVRAPGYQEMEKTATLSVPGAVEVIDFALVKETNSGTFAQSGAAKRGEPKRKVTS